MTVRFERLGIMDRLVLVTILSGLTMFMFPHWADASVQNKPFVFEIKSLQTLKISDLAAKLSDDSETTEVAFTEVPEVKKVELVVKQKVLTSENNPLLPKVIGDDRVYMHEPEIRAYLCPKLGDKCNIFIAILKAENGTHECTRDNRGLNKNGSIDIGLTQINWTPNSPYTMEQLRDCKFNLDIAMQKYKSRGFQPWAAYNSGRYLKHLPAVLASAAQVN